MMKSPKVTLTTTTTTTLTSSPPSTITFSIAEGAIDGDLPELLDVKATSCGEESIFTIMLGAEGWKWGIHRTLSDLINLQKQLLPEGKVRIDRLQRKVQQEHVVKTLLQAIFRKWDDIRDGKFSDIISDPESWINILLEFLGLKVPNEPDSSHLSPEMTGSQMPRLIRVNVPNVSSSAMGSVWITVRCRPSMRVKTLQTAVIEKLRKNPAAKQTSKTLNFKTFHLETENGVKLPKEYRVLHFLSKVGQLPAHGKQVSLGLVGSSRESIEYKSKEWTEDEFSLDVFEANDSRSQGSGKYFEESDGELAKALSRNKRKVGLKDFIVIKVIGRGGFGKVMLVKEKKTKEVFAIKAVQKQMIEKTNQVERVRTERRVLALLKHPYIVPLKYAFQTRDKLYFVLKYCPGGELFFHLSRDGKFTESKAQFYSAQILLAIGHLHGKDIVYRDLKPENVLLDEEGHACLADFGTSKIGVSGHFSTYSLCGTPEYFAPEIISKVGHGKAADWWAFGCLLFEMLGGLPPFFTNSDDREILFRAILESRIKMPVGLSSSAKRILAEFLCRDPNKRLGSKGDMAEIKAHPFYKSVDWDLLCARKLTAPWKPQIGSLSRDTRYFDEEFTQMSVRTSSGSFGEGLGSADYDNFTYVEYNQSYSCSPTRISSNFNSYGAHSLKLAMGSSGRKSLRTLGQLDKLPSSSCLGRIINTGSSDSKTESTRSSSVLKSHDGVGTAPILIPKRR